VIESNVISKFLKKNTTNNYNHLISKKYNIITRIYMDRIAKLKKKNYNFFFNFKNLNNYFSNNFKIIREILTSLTNEIEVKFV